MPMGKGLFGSEEQVIEEVEVQAAGPPTMKNIDKRVSLTGNSPKLDDIKPKNAELEKPVESSA